VTASEVTVGATMAGAIPRKADADGFGARGDADAVTAGPGRAGTAPAKPSSFSMP